MKEQSFFTRVAMPGLAVLAAVGCGGADGGAQTVTGIAAVRVASGLSQPLFVTAPPGDTQRLFIVRQTGQVNILNLQTGALNALPFLDIQSRLTATTGEQGLLGLAFDPNYASNGKFYLDFTVPGGVYSNGTTHVSQFQVSATNADVADMSNEKILLTFDHPYANHNGGWIAFSPRPGDDNNLYITTGDGGNGNDQGTGHIEPTGNAQTNVTWLGKMLRIHIDSAAGTYSIPPNNPFAGSASFLNEIWLFGLRNPFRASFDRQTLNLFIGDVGQSTREEIDVQSAANPSGGENYGWRLREGLVATPGVGGAEPPGAIDPILDYPRTTGQCVIGGYVYRGRQVPSLQGVYVFADYQTPNIFSLRYDGATATAFQTITSQLFPTSTGGFSLSHPAGFGEDANGEIYIADYGSASVFRIVPVTPALAMQSAVVQPNGHVVLSGYGVPFKSHTIQATPDLVQPFATIGSAVANGAGDFQFTDTGAGTSNRFYRVLLQ